MRSFRCVSTTTAFRISDAFRCVHSDVFQQPRHSEFQMRFDVFIQMCFNYHGSQNFRCIYMCSFRRVSTTTAFRKSKAFRCVHLDVFQLPRHLEFQMRFDYHVILHPTPAITFLRGPAVKDGIAEKYNCHFIY